MVAIVLLPGLDGTGSLFADFAAALGQEVEPIVVSYPTDIAAGYAELEAVARSFLPTDRPFYLLGESFSGPIAIAIAASRPPGLRGLVLCCSFARTPRPVLALFRPLLSIVPVKALPVGLLSFFVLGRFSTPALRRRLGETIAAVSPAALRARARAALSVNVSSALSTIEVPVRYLRSTEDRVIPASASRRIVALAPKTRVVEFSAPHFLLQTAPSQAAASVLEFMDELERQPSRG